MIDYRAILRYYCPDHQPMKQFTAQVLDNRKIARDCYEIQFNWKNPEEKPLPGQFVTIRNSTSSDPLLRRPFAVASYDPSGQTAALIYQLRGKATQELSSKRKDEMIDVLGPLGNGFPEPANVDGKPPAACVLVAGGTGIGPIFYLARELAAGPSHISVVVGTRDRAHLPVLPVPTGIDLVQCTEDGSLGFKGTSIDYLRTLHVEDGSSMVIYACGPEGMLEACHRFAEEQNLGCWVSMEQVMGCGVGACMGCVVKIHGEKKYARVCTEGPVFDSREIVWK